MLDFTVLIVDDNLDILRSVERILVSRGAKVVPSATPFGVGALVVRHRPDVLVLDVMMPALDGAALAAMLGESPTREGPPIVFYSALPEEELYALTRRIAGTHYVQKGDGAFALVAAIERILDDRRRRASVRPRAHG